MIIDCYFQFLLNVYVGNGNTYIPKKIFNSFGGIFICLIHFSSNYFCSISIIILNTYVDTGNIHFFQNIQ